MKYYGSLEAGGTKMVCAIGDEQGHILERVSISHAGTGKHHARDPGFLPE